MNKNFKILNKSLSIFLISLIILFGLFNTNFLINATSTANADYIENSIVKTVNLDYGLKYTSVKGSSKFTTTGAYVDQVCNYIEVPTNDALLITTWSKFKNDSWKRASIVNIAKDFEAKHPGYRVLAITNGDFYDIKGEDDFPYSSMGALVCDSNFYKTTPTRRKGYKVVSFNNDGSVNPITGFDQSIVKVKKLPSLTIYDENDQIIKIVEINKVNEAPLENEIAVYYGTYINKLYDSSETDKNAKKTFVVTNPINWLPNGVNDFYGLGVIDSLGSRVLAAGEFAICSNNSEIESLLGKGVKIRVQYEWDGEASNVTNAINAGTQILVNGEAPSNVNTADGSRMNARHPRTAIGVKEDGTVVLMVNDGRQPETGRNGSYGNELAAMMKHYGCVNAFNLDGGGSSIMYYRDGDNFVLGNSFSDPPERTVSNCVVVAVKDPEIQVSFDRIGSKEIDITVNLLNDNKHEVEEIYARIGTKTQRIENGKATFTGLSPLTGYEIGFSFMNDKGIEYKLPYKYSFGTKAREYRFNDINISLTDNNYIFELDYSDKANATTLAEAIIYINGKNYQMSEGKLIVDKDEIGIIDEIKLEFNNQIYQGTETIILVNPHAPYLNTLNDALKSIETMLEDIFK